jgi:hypothetical protein
MECLKDMFCFVFISADQWFAWHLSVRPSIGPSMWGGRFVTQLKKPPDDVIEPICSGVLVIARPLHTEA